MVRSWWRRGRLLFVFPAVCALTFAGIARAEDPNKKDEPAKAEKKELNEQTPEEWAAQIEKDFIANTRVDRKAAKEVLELNTKEFLAKHPTSPAQWSLKALAAQATLTPFLSTDANKKEVLEMLIPVFTSQDAPESAKKIARSVAQTVFSSIGIDDDETKTLAKLEPYSKSEVDAIAAAAKARMRDAQRLIDLKSKPFEMKFTALNGADVDLNDYRGKVVLIEFRATLCKPCVAELPEIKATYDKLHDQGFEIIGISFDRPESKVKLETFVAEKQIPWPQYFEGGSDFGRKYGISGIPAMWLVGKDGKIATFHGRGKLEERVGKLLAK